MRNGLGAVRRIRPISQWNGFHLPNHHIPPWESKTFLSRSYASVSAADLQFGQPVHETHPHLLKPEERMLHIFQGAALVDLEG